MSQEPNKSTPQPGISPGRRVWMVPAVVILVCVTAVVAMAFRRAPAKVSPAPIAQGELINPPVQTNSAPVVPAAASVPQSPAPMAAAVSPVASENTRNGDYLQIGFDKLASFPLRLHWVLVDPVRIKGVQKMMDAVPANIKSLDDSKIAVRGFMLPLKLEDGLVTEFFLLRTQARCCYGLPIQMNELLTVHMAKPGVKSIMDQPITIYGRLHISESHDGTGALTSIYTLDGDKMDGPAAL